MNTQYTMQIFDIKKGKSQQRRVQVAKDQPIQYMFAFDYKKPEKPVQGVPQALAQAE